jgi:hypothetical protein
VRELTEWISTTTFPDKPWLLLGKGPSFSRRGEFDLDGYNLFSLNHVVRELDVRIASTMSVRVITDCANVLETNCDYLVVPRVLADRNEAFVHRLEDCVETIPVLRDLDEAGRLVWYNYERFRPFGRSPVLLGLFSISEASVQVIAHIGARRVHTLGIDGGTVYSSSFSDIQTERLARGSFPYDGQFRELNKIRLVHGIDIVPLVEPESGAASELLTTPVPRGRRRRAVAEFACRRALRRLPAPLYDGLRNTLWRLPASLRRRLIS